MPRIDDILKKMIECDASDLHLTSGCAPYLRVHGEMVKLNYKDLSAEVCQALIFRNPFGNTARDFSRDLGPRLQLFVEGNRTISRKRLSTKKGSRRGLSSNPRTDSND